MKWLWKRHELGIEIGRDIFLTRSRCEDMLSKPSGSNAKLSSHASETLMRRKSAEGEVPTRPVTYPGEAASLLGLAWNQKCFHASTQSAQDPEAPFICNVETYYSPCFVWERFDGNAAHRHARSIWCACIWCHATHILFAKHRSEPCSTGIPDPHRLPGIWLETL